MIFLGKSHSMKRITYFTIYFEKFAGKRQSMFKTLTNVLNQTLKIEKSTEIPNGILASTSLSNFAD